MKREKVRPISPKRTEGAAKADAIRSIFESNPKAILRLGAATDAGQFWSAAQALLVQAAPSSKRWLCLRPIGAATAMMLLRETAPGHGARAKPAKLRQPDEKDAAILEELFSHHPAILHFRDHPGLPLIHLSGGLAGKGGSRGAGQGETKRGAALAFWRRRSLKGLLLLHRSEAEGDFTKTELRALRQLHPHLETALCRVITVRQHEARNHLLAGVLKPLPLPLILCDWQSKIICESAAGREARSHWEQGEGHRRYFSVSTRRALPPDLVQHCRARWTRWEKAKPSARAALEKKVEEIGHPRLRSLSTAVSMARHRDFPLVKPIFLFRFQTPVAATLASPRRSAGQAASLAALSVREREIALLVCAGYSNAAISEQLGKSLHTVKAQISSIFQKLKVGSRAGLFALVGSISNRLPGLVLSGLFASVMNGPLL